MKSSKTFSLFSWVIVLILLLYICKFEFISTRTNPFFKIQSAQAANQPKPNQIFLAVRAELAAKTRVPLMLPDYIPKESYPLYVTINTAQLEHYELTIGATPDCSGGNYCRYGTVSGQRITASAPTVEQEYAFMNDPSYRPTERSPQKMGRVVLTNGIKAYFIPYVCGANCDDSKVIWEQNGYRYLVGLKAENKRTVVEMANSAIVQSHR